MSIKFEVGTTPPLGFETEVKILTPPITASIKELKFPYLFSGRMDAILFGKWATRIKGRDFYDLLWYIGQKTPINLGYLENKMREGGLMKYQLGTTNSSKLPSKAYALNSLLHQSRGLKVLK